MGLFDRFKKKNQEEDVSVVPETDSTPEVTSEADEPETEITETETAPVEEEEAGDEAPAESENTAEEEVPAEEEVSAEEEHAAVEESSETAADAGEAPALTPELAQGIFNESVAAYQAIPEGERKAKLKDALMFITNDPLSQTFLEASHEGMATPERVRNNISHTDELECRLALVQLASEGEGRSREEQTLLGQTQTLLFRRILELNPKAGTSADAASRMPEGETPVEFLQQEVQLKALEKELQNAQKDLTEANAKLKELHDSVTGKYADSELSEEEKSEKTEEELKNFTEYQDAMKAVSEKTERFQTARQNYLKTADQLAVDLKDLPVIYAAYDSRMIPEAPWISNNGHTEIYTSKALAAQVQKGFERQGITNMKPKELRGEEITEYVRNAQHLGITHFLLDNGRTPIDLRFDRVEAFKEANLLEYVNRAIRFEFLRAKGYGLSYGTMTEEEQQSEGGQNVRDKLLTMLFNAYRELGMGISYTLVKAPHKDDTTCYTEAAMEKAKSLKERVFKDSTLIAPGDKRIEAMSEPLSLALVKRGNVNVQSKEEIEKLPSLVPIFSDIAAARTLQANLAIQHARYEILAVTWDDIKKHAANQPGIVYEPDMFGLFIPKEDFPKVDQFRNVRGSIVIDHHRSSL